jgi:hypothetical protein
MHGNHKKNYVECVVTEMYQGRGEKDLEKEALKVSAKKPVYVITAMGTKTNGSVTIWHVFAALGHPSMDFGSKLYLDLKGSRAYIDLANQLYNIHAIDNVSKERLKAITETLKHED